MEYSGDITELFNVLMTLEMQLVEQLEVRLRPLGTDVMPLCPARLISKNLVMQLQNHMPAGVFTGAPLQEASSGLSMSDYTFLLVSPVFAFNTFQSFRLQMSPVQNER